MVPPMTTQNDLRIPLNLLPADGRFGSGPSKVRVDIQMQQPDSGLNLADYLEKKEDK